MNSLIPIIVFLMVIFWIRHAAKPYWCDKAKVAYRQIENIYGYPDSMQSESGGMATWNDKCPFHLIAVVDTLEFEDAPLVLAIKYVVDKKITIPKSKYTWHCDNLLYVRSSSLQSGMESLVAFDKLHNSLDIKDVVAGENHSDLLKRLIDITSRYEIAEKNYTS